MVIYKQRTDATVQWTGALATNAAATADITLTSYPGYNGQIESILRGITVASVQNLAWEFDFFMSNTYQGSSTNTDTFIGRWSFAATDGVQIAATGDYLYYIDGLEIPLWNTDTAAITGGNGAVAGTAQLHIALVNRSATSKIAGASGNITATLWLEVMQAGGGA
jgi:hypothetical protein